MKTEWIESIRDQCRAAGVPFFFKQWGGTRKAKAGRLLDGRTYDEKPARVMNPMPDDDERKAMLADVLARVGCS